MRTARKRYWSFVLIGTAISFALFWEAFDYSKESLIKASHEHIPQKHRAVLKEISAFQRDKNTYLSMLIHHPDVLAYIASPDEAHRKRVEQLFYYQAKSELMMMQLRLLDMSGHENIRVDRSDEGSVTLTPSVKLQDKSKRDYFLQFKHLRSGEMGFSKLDLNIENGRVEIPFKPTLRIGMPIYVNREIKGIVIINYAMSTWLDQLSDSAFLNLYLIDPNGYFIIHPNRALYWSGYKNPPISASKFFQQTLITPPKKGFVRYDKFLAAQIHLWGKEPYTIVYEPKEQTVLNLNKRISIIGLYIFLGILILLLPFAQLLLEYIRKLQRARFILEESEQRLTAIFNNTYDAIIIINKKGEIQRCNMATSSIFGYSETELLGCNVNLLIPEPHHSKHNGYLASYDKTVASKILGQERELFGLHKTGQSIPVSIGVTQVHIDNELFFIGTIRDISHEKQNKQLFENVFTQAPMGVALVLEDGSLWRLNKHFCDIVGYTEDELRRMTFQEITHSDDLQNDLTLVSRLLKGEIPTYTLEKRYIHKNGSIVWVNLLVTAIFLDPEHRKLEYFIAMVENISERKTMIEKLSQTQNRLIEAERIAMIGHWEWNQQTNNMLWSQSMLELFGETSESFCPNYEKFIRKVHYEDQEYVRTTVRNSLKEHHPLDLYFRIVLEQSEKIIHAKANITYDGDKPVQMFGTCQDVTKLKQLEEKEKEQERMLMQQSKLVAMGEMVGAIAHQWRQPLNTIGLTVQDLLPAYKHGELDENYLKTSQTEMMRQLHYMSKTIDEFRNFFTKSHNADSFNLLNALDEVQQLYWAQLKVHDITLKILCQNGDAAPVPHNFLDGEEKKGFDTIGASSEYKQVVLNCISNAKDAVLSLKSADEIQKTITVVVQKHENALSTIISDFAGGIDPSVRERIFEPYYTTREMGTGLGLYIAKMITERTLHGSIECIAHSATLGDHLYNGSRFIITLPKSETENRLPDSTV